MTAAPTHHGAPLIGRTADLDALAEQIAAARAGRGSATLVCGEPGLGKTALVEAAAASAEGFSVLRCRGIEIEMALPFSGLHELLLPLTAVIDELPAAQRDAVQGAFRAASGQAPPVLAVALGTLTAIAQRAAQRPILVIADDLQWLDEASLLVLAFVARRIAHDPVALLMTSRTVEVHETIPSTRIDLAPLTHADIRELAERESRRRVHDSTAVAVANATGGNPLAVIEAVRLLGDEVELVGSALDEPLPASQLIERGLGSRLTDLPNRSLQAVTVAAVALTDSAETIIAAAERLELSDEDLAAAEQAGIIERRFDAVAFGHPLFRSLAYHLADPELRRRCHAALSAVAPDRASRAWHAAAATTRADEAIATELAAVADDLTNRGGHLAAAHAYERAASLTPDHQTRASRFYAAGVAARRTGRASWTSMLLDEAHALASEGTAIELRIELERILHSAHTGSNTGLAERMLTLARRAEGVDHDLLVDLHAMAAGESGLKGDYARVRAILDELDRLEPASDPDIHASTAVMLSMLLPASRGDGDAGEAALLEAAHALIERPSYPSGAVAYHLLQRGLDELAQDVLAAMFDYVGRSEDLHSLATALWTRGMVAFQRGDWAAAEVAVEQSLQVADVGRMRWQQTLSTSLLAIIRALRGDAAALDLAAAAAEAAERYDHPSMLRYYGLAVGLYELGLGRAEAAAAALGRVAADPVSAESQNPNFTSWHWDYIEALILNGKRAEARSSLGVFRTRVDRAGVDWTRAIVARLDGLLARDDAAPAHFERSIARFEATVPRPFELARTRLAYGRCLRRLGREAEARVQLAEALVVFDRLGAAPWAQQARTELAGLGATQPSPPAASAPALTSQERVVADCVAQGMTNKEAAAHLFLTVKTIEWHLRQIYRKLGIRSRVQLATYVNARR